MSRLLLALLAVALLAAAPAGYASYPLRGNVGKPLPEFHVQTLGGRAIDSRTFRGRWTLDARKLLCHLVRPV